MKRFLFSAALLVGAAFSAFAADGNELPTWALGGFQRAQSVNPIITPVSTTTFLCPHRGTEVNWECADTFNPAAVVRNDTIFVLYRAEDDPNAGIGGRTSRIGLAAFHDGVNIDYRLTEPVMYPNGSDISKTYEWKGGCEDPRVVERPDGTYVMTFTSWNNKTPRLSIATSTDLIHWTHHGPAFLTALDGKFKDLSCKSGSIVTEIKDGRMQMARVNGKYLMYWGEQYVAAATSDDGITWTPLVDENNNLIHLIEPRQGHFDSQLTECGPPAVVTDDGILLLYNGKNNGNINKMDPNYPANTYAAGQVLFSKDNPYEVKARLDNAFFRPMESYEKTGQYAAGTVFIEGLVYKDKKWYLYYGCADSMVGVAIYDTTQPKAEGDPIELDTSNVPQGIINNFPVGGVGKVRSLIHSYSGATKGDESPFYLGYSYIDAKKKWCDTSTEHPWVIFELTDYYSLNRFVFRDVAPYENGNGNVPEYWIYTSTTGTEDADWTLQVHRTGMEAVDVKDDTLAAPVEARYVKFVATRGTRTDNGNHENAIRIYGFDIYGEFSRPIDRDGIVSIGKTLMKQYDCTQERETARNLLDGHHDSKERKWCFHKADINNDPYKFAVIDLEDTFDISKFVIYDCKNIEVDDNMDAYQIYVSEEKPNLSLITPQGDTNTCWTKVVDRTGVGSEATKTDELLQTIRGRYVKLVVPRTEDSMNAHTSRVYEFDVYGTKTATGIHAVSSREPLRVVGNKLYVNSDRAERLALYNMEGKLVAKVQAEPHTTVSLPVSRGLYLLKTNAQTVKVCL